MRRREIVATPRRGKKPIGPFINNLKLMTTLCLHYTYEYRSVDKCGGRAARPCVLHKIYPYFITVQSQTRFQRGFIFWDSGGEQKSATSDLFLKCYFLCALIEPLFQETMPWRTGEIISGDQSQVFISFKDTSILLGVKLILSIIP